MTDNLIIFPDRALRIAFWNTEPRLVDGNLMSLERNLALFGEVSIKDITGLDDPTFLPCDLLIIAAQGIPEDHFAHWLEKLQQNIKAQGQIWIPALIVSEASFGMLCSIFRNALKQNWYFDVISPRHIDSLPMRVVNLLRIHDHLHELKRYGAVLEDLNEKVIKLENSLEIMKKKK